jgi:putative oxidoreductase
MASRFGSRFEGWEAWATVLLQVTLGAIFMAHGAQKLFGTFQGPGITGLAGMLQKYGFTPPVFWAWVAAIVEFFGGLFIFFGFLTRIWAAILIVHMIVAIVKVNWALGFFWTKGGLEFPLTLAIIALTLVLTGPSFLSVDRAVGLEERPTRPGRTLAHATR